MVKATLAGLNRAVGMRVPVVTLKHEQLAIGHVIDWSSALVCSDFVRQVAGSNPSHD